MENPIDLFVIGGGINGVGIAADAAGRNLRVTLCEQNDLASGTSSKSTKLIHGGLRYLEYYEFRLIREALTEREILMSKAPHLIHPLDFVMPYHSGFKPVWMMRLGFFLYDHLTKRHRLPSSRFIKIKAHPATKILKNTFNKGFLYSDCWTDDARLVVLNAMAAREKGARILTRTRFVSAKQENHHWKIEIENTLTKVKEFICAKVLINAAGPWGEEVSHCIEGTPILEKLVKGSHIVVPVLYPEKFAFTLRNTDDRVIFVLPYLDKFSLIGTTEVLLSEVTNGPEITETEMRYLCEAVNNYFNKSISLKDIVWSYAGTRALQNEKKPNNLSAISRDYTLLLEANKNQPPLLSVIGGKLTTYRKLAEHVLEKLGPFFPSMGAPWTATAPLPGGDIPNADFSKFCQQVKSQYSWVPEELLHRYLRSYGTLALKLLENCHRLEDLGKDLGAGLYQKELDYLQQEEWAMTMEDVLWRRTKLGAAKHHPS